MGYRVLFLGLILSFHIFSVSAQTSTSQPYDRAGERVKMLAILDNPPVQELDLVGLESADQKSRALVEFFRDHLWKTEQQLYQLIIKASVYQAARDRALYESNDEKEQWASREVEAMNQMELIKTDPKRQELIRQFGKLAEGLSGEFAEYARRQMEDQELGAFTSREMPLLERLNKIQHSISDIANTSPISSKLAATDRAMNELIKLYFEGSISFSQAWHMFEAYQSQGYSALGQDVATRGAALFEEAAVIRTKLAKSKGFKNWAEYMVAQQARNYGEGHKTANYKIKFLRGILEASKVSYINFLKKRLGEVGGSLEQLRNSQIGLLALEGDTMIREYFPADRAIDIWKDTLSKSGFDSDALNLIVVDAFPRAGKQTHAYMTNLTSHIPKVFRIDSKDLSVERPKEKSAWFPAHIVINQNFRDDGFDSLSTMLHEGGHSTDYIFQEDVTWNGASYGYTETHSMTMERFGSDVEWLMENGINRKGEHLPRDVAERFITHSMINELVSARRQAAQAILDIEVWNYDYEAAGAESFVSRMLRIRGETSSEATLAKGFVVDQVDSRAGAFSTHHFYSGDVRYYGYIVANLAADLTAEHLLNVAEARSGRRTLLNQPWIAEHLINGYYRLGFLKPFPDSVVEFTGLPFSPERAMSSVVARAETYQAGFCAERIRRLK